MSTSSHTPVRSWRNALGLAGRLVAWSAIALIVLTAVGKVLTDRFQWSQYLFWLPTIGAAVVAGVLLAISHAIAALARRSAGVWVRRAALGGVAALLVYSMLVEWSGGGEQPMPARGARVRLVYWNFNTSGEPGWEGPAIDQDADVVVVRAGTCTQPEGLHRRMGENSHFCWESGFMVASKLPIRAFGYGSLNVEQGMGLDPRAESLIRKGRDPGRAMWLILDAGDRLGRDMVVWLVDMPSDLSLWRGTAMRQANESLRAGPPHRFIADELGRWVQAPETKLARASFGNPDLIVGDFNTPHGAHSIEELTQGYQSAFDRAGRGYAATFPRGLPLWQLDQAFTGPMMRACTHEIVDAGSGTHRMLVLDLALVGTR